MVEITVRGAGIFGLSIAWICRQRGAKVQIIDPAGPGAGSSGGIVGALAPHVPENWNPKKAFQFDSLGMAESFWRGVETTTGLASGYSRSGRVQPIADAAALALARNRTEGAARLWRGAATWEVRRDCPGCWMPETPTGWYIFDTLSAHLHPRQACAALADALKASSVPIRREGENRGRVIWATGIAGLTDLTAGRDRAVGAGIKGQAALLRHDAAGAPQIFAGGVHVIPHLDGTVAVGSTSEREFDSPHTTDHLLDDVVAAARAAVPALAAADVIATWAGVRPRARSRAPMLGPWPDRPGHFIANGGFKIGFGMAPKVAQTMADLVLDDIWSIPDGFEVTASL